MYVSMEEWREEEEEDDDEDEEGGCVLCASPQNDGRRPERPLTIVSAKSVVALTFAGTSLGTAMSPPSKGFAPPLPCPGPHPRPRQSDRPLRGDAPPARERLVRSPGRRPLPSPRAPLRSRPRLSFAP